MKKKILIVGPEARKKVIDGADYLANAVKLTLGPYGRNFASGIRGGAIRISNDGVSLAKEIEGRDEFEDVGVRAVREAATKTNDIAGDGTTTAMVLVQAILRSMKFDSTIISSKTSPNELAKQAAEESAFVVEKLNEMAKPITSREDLVALTRVSVEDEALANLIGGAQWDVGAAGTVVAEEHNAADDSVEFIYGIRIDNGFGTSRLINNEEKQMLELENAHIILTNKVFHGNFKGLEAVFDQLVKIGASNVVLMGRAFDELAIGVALKNIEQGALKLYPVNCPYVDQDQIMEDLAAATGGKYINTSERNLDSIQFSDVGFATKIIAKRFEGIVIGKKPGDDERIDGLVAKRLANIEEKLKGQITPFEKRNLETRQAQLKSGTAIIRVGAETEQERAYKKDKVDDAVNAAKAALQEGVVPGGGTALYTVADMLEHKYPDSILAAALREPYLQIMANAGAVFEIPDWVKDPLKVVRTGFQKASSIARSLATTEIVVNWEREKPTLMQPVANTAPSDEE